MRQPRVIRCGSGSQRGLAVVEGLLALAVLQVAVLAVTFAIVAGQRRLQSANAAMRGIDLAEQLMEAIIALPYADPDGPSGLGPDPGEADRAEFDNADDYHGYTDSTTDPLDPAGRALTRTVTCSLVSENVPDLGVSFGGLSVTITVDDGHALNWSVTRFIPDPTS